MLGVTSSRGWEGLREVRCVGELDVVCEGKVSITDDFLTLDQSTQVNSSLSYRDGKVWDPKNLENKKLHCLGGGV